MWMVTRASVCHCTGRVLQLWNCLLNMSEKRPFVGQFSGDKSLECPSQQRGFSGKGGRAAEEQREGLGDSSDGHDFCGGRMSLDENHHLKRQWH
ncbi:hypothetical protein E2C01_020052 [Portunus trituberculatus]|uniref:Uncharacterized protein n=1 Tax=Portunus trituberculatus TaxID=210409 RepID=A0A5B7DYZ6_PORTR|nr:hypothetical protein [Portunus trituberculatus]